MIAHDLQATIRQQIADEVSFRVFSERKLGISLPLLFGDGDACELTLERMPDGRSVLSDDGYVLALGRMQGVHFRSAGYRTRFQNVASYYGATEEDGALTISVDDDSGLGDAIFVLSQACLEASRVIETRPDIKRKSRAFTKHFSTAVETSLKLPYIHNWTDPEYDPKGIYPVDYCVELPESRWFILGVGSSARCWKAATTIKHYKLKSVSVTSVCAYCDSAERDSSAFAAIADNANYKFSLDTERKQFEKFLKREIRL